MAARETEFQIVLVTVPDMEMADEIAGDLIENRLAACVNIISGVKSAYRWKGKVEKTDECLLVIKSRPSVFRELSSRVGALHTYDTPEIIAIPIEEGSRPYMQWLNESIRGGGI